MASGICSKLQGLLIVGQPPEPLRPDSGLLHDAAQRVLHVPDVAAGLQQAQDTYVELVIFFSNPTSQDGLPFLKHLCANLPQVPVVVVAQNGSVDQAVRFIRAGAYDFIAGPLSDEVIRRLLEGLMAERQAAADRQDRYLCNDCPPGMKIVGRSKGLVRVLEMIRLVSQSRCNPVLILGETGTGKELVARAVHAWRCGDNDKFVAINCATLTANLLESELFGHVKGAFTGADREKTGLFELAQDGSIFLDEISEMPLELQAKLLRVLQENTFRKVGGVRDIRCNATIIASSNRDLLQEVGKGRFRRDLYYRLAIFPVTVPPLRSPDRGSDIPLLAEYFIENSGIPACNGRLRLSPAAAQRLMEHSWPGNVRELRNVIERAMILEKSEEVQLSSLVFDHLEPPKAPAAAAGISAKDFSLETAEREFIIRALKETGWQRTRAAALLGITRATLHAKLKRYQIELPKSSSGDSDAVEDGPAGLH